MTTSSRDAATADDVAAPPKVSVGRQALRREVNQRTRALHDPFASEELDVYCECGRAGCSNRVTVSTQTYDELRRVPTHFLVKTGHAADDDRVVGEWDEFVVVEKFGRSGVEAVALDRGRRS